MPFESDHRTISYMCDIKPLHKPIGIPVLQSVRGISLTQAAAEMMAANAQTVSEGVVDDKETAEPIYRGSTMVSIDLGKPCFDVRTDEETLAQLLRSAARSLTLHIRLMRLARLEAERRVTPLFVREMRAETAFRIVDKRLLVDIDIECPLAVSMGETSGTHAGGKS